MVRVTLIGKAGCHLCDDARTAIAAVCAETGDQWSELSIEDDPALFDEYWERIPVILVNGFNVYPREIELVIDDLDGVAEAAVLGVPDDVTGEAVTALVVAKRGSGLSTEQIAEHCAGRLARFKCPTVIRVVEALPHSATGKVAKGRLRDVYGDTGYGS